MGGASLSLSTKHHRGDQGGREERERSHRSLSLRNRSGKIPLTILHTTISIDNRIEEEVCEKKTKRMKTQ